MSKLKVARAALATAAAITAVATASPVHASDWAGTWGGNPGGAEPMHMTVNGTDPFSAQVHMMWGQAGSCLANWTETTRVSASDRIVMGQQAGDFPCYNGDHWYVTIEPGDISGHNLDHPEMGFEVTPP